MALTTQTYDELKLYIESVIGSELKSNELTRVNSLINFAAKRAYRETQWWDRFLVTGEPRTASRGEINTSEDSFHVYGAGTAAVNGLYVRNGTVNGKAAYTLYDTDGTTELYSIEWDNSTDWQLLSAADAVIYDITDASTTPPLLGWAANTGTAPAPLLVDVADIDTFIYVDQYDSYQDRVSRGIDGHATGGKFKLHQSSSSNVLYVTYKKTHTDVYGDGTSGTVSDIPSEWFNYIGLHAAYMYLTSQRGSNPNGYTGIAYAEVREAMQDELMRLEQQGLSNISRRVQTHLSYNTSL